VLSDPKQAIPPYDAILLLAPNNANDKKLAAALKPLIGAINVKTMSEANLRAAGGDVLPGAVAKWLWGKIEKK
jgi:osmoprotectant transport system permease protein